MIVYRGLFFGDYMVPGADPAVYDEISDFVKLTSTVERSVCMYDVCKFVYHSKIFFIAPQ